MGWANYAIKELQLGKIARIRPRGHSMKGKVDDGDEVVLEAIAPADIRVGDIVLVRVKGNVFLHLVKAVDPHRVLIGNNRGKINGWASKNAVFGVAVEVAGRRLAKDQPQPAS